MNGVVNHAAIEFEIGILEAILNIALDHKGAPLIQTWSDTFTKMNRLFSQFMQLPSPTPALLPELPIFPVLPPCIVLFGPPAQPAASTRLAEWNHCSSLVPSASTSRRGSSSPMLSAAELAELYDLSGPYKESYDHGLGRKTQVDWGGVERDDNRHPEHAQMSESHSGVPSADPMFKPLATHVTVVKGA